MSSNSKSNSNKRQQPTPTPSVVSSSDYEAEDTFLSGGAAEQSFTSSLPGGIPTYHIQHPPTTTVTSMPPPVEDPHYESSSSSGTAGEDGSPFSNQNDDRYMPHTRSMGSSSTSEASNRRSQSHSMSNGPHTYNEGPLIPHRQSLRKISLEIRQSYGSHAEDALQPPLHRHPKVLYSIELQCLTEKQEEDIRRRGGLSSLIFTKSQLDAMQRLFLVLDTENKGYITFQQAEDFVYSRCPVVYRRDQRISIQMQQHSEYNSYLSCTLVEAWRTIVESGLLKEQLASLIHTPERSESNADADYFICQNTVLGLEGWMILLRLISFCQYHEAKQFFSAKRLGNTMVVVDVPRDPSIIPLTMDYLLQFELKFDYRKVLNGDNSKKTKTSHNSVFDSPQKPINYCPPMPELDLNHSGMAAQENAYVNFGGECGTFRLPTPIVYIEALGSYSDAAWKAGKVDLNLSLTSTDIARSRIDLSHVGAKAGLMSTSIECTTSTTTVRRSLEDLMWLNNTFVTHKKLGGTLCGRILPSFFPEENIHRVAPTSTSASDGIDFHYPTDKSSGGSSSTTSAVFSYVKSVGKTVLGTLQKTSGLSLTSSGTSSRRKGSGDFGSVGQEARLKRLNRCTNYLLEHTGLQRSFPLNSFLKASKTGLEASKRIIEDGNKSFSGVPGGSHSTSSSRSDGGGSNPTSLKSGSSTETVNASGQSERSSQVSGHQAESSGYVSLNWIRNAAQAAVTLKVHGILNATGMSSYSARLQHASLPDFDYHQSYRGMSTQNLHPSHLQNPIQSVVKAEEGSKPDRTSPALSQQGIPGSDAFECNVTSVACGLDDEYDLLPSPQKGGRKMSIYEENENLDSREGGSSSPTGTTAESDSLSSINATVESLRGLIKSVDDNLQRCIVAHDKISITSRARAELCTSIVRALDANSDHGDLIDGFNTGLTMDEQHFLRGMTDLLRSHELQYQAGSNFEEEFSWQASLSEAAVSAANDVRAASRAAKRAGGAKRAAEAAAQSALKSLERQLEVSTGPSEATEITQSRYEDARSRAMNAAIVAHETTTVKRKAALALAHDVRQWSDHRRREVFKTCIAFSKLQRDGARASAGAWTVLKDAATGPMESEQGFHIQYDASSQSKARKDTSPHKTSGHPKQTGVQQAIVDNFYDTDKTKSGSFLRERHPPPSQPAQISNAEEDRFNKFRHFDDIAPPDNTLVDSSSDHLTTSTSHKMNNQSFSNPLQEGFHSLPSAPFAAHTGLTLTAEDEAGYSSNDLLPLQAPYSLDSEYRDIVSTQDHVGLGLLDNAFRNLEGDALSPEVTVSPPICIAPSDSSALMFDENTSVENTGVEQNEAPTLDLEVSTELQDRGAETRTLDPYLETDKSVSLVKSMDGLELSGDDSTEIVNAEGSKSDEDRDFDHSTDATDKTGAAVSSSIGDGCSSENNAMTESMQSLVDGLMAWGNRYDPADDIPIPEGLVASILEDGNQLDDHDNSDAEIIQ